MAKSEKTCEEVLLDYIKNNEGWHKKVHLYAVAEDWSPETVGRTLRDMANPPDNTKPTIEKGEYLGKYRKTKLAQYRLIGKKQYRILVTEYGEEIKIEI